MQQNPFKTFNGPGYFYSGAFPCFYKLLGEAKAKEGKDC